MTEISEDMIEAAWSREQEPVAQLVTIHADADPTPIRATDWPDGVTSNGVFYPHFPFRLTWAGASRDEAFGHGRLAIDNVDGRIEEACEASVTPPTMDLALVRVAAPNAVERALIGASIPAIEGDESEVTATILPRDFSTEPACGFSYTPADFQAMF